MTKDPFEEYLRQSEPNKRDLGYAWQTAVGLQAVDGLETSHYLIETAKKNIEGEISLEEANALINSYYAESAQHGLDRTEEADKVSARIAQLLAEKTFVFSPAQYLSIHKRLFAGIYKHAGQIRDYNITKKEWVLDGNTVIYGGASELRATLDYDFATEEAFRYDGLSMSEIIAHLATFVSHLWQIHVFGEGNTRTTAVFFIKYLRTLGFDVTNDIFAGNAWYFRNSLVRANYNDLKNGVHETNEFLEQFLENLLLGAKHELKNRYLHVDYAKQAEVQSAAEEAPKCKNCTLEELAVLRAIAAEPTITQKKLATVIGKSERTVKSRTVELQEKGYLRRENGKRNGRWELSESAKKGILNE